MVGIVNAKRIWQVNQKFWADKKLPLKQEMIFASTGTKKPEDPPWKYVEAFAGSDIETNPPGHQRGGAGKAAGPLPARWISCRRADVLAEIDREVDMKKLEKTLMEEGVKKFADPQKMLLSLIAERRAMLQASRPEAKAGAAEKRRAEGVSPGLRRPR